MNDAASAAPTYDQVVAAWNAQADKYNQWDELGEDEKIEWALKFAQLTPPTAAPSDAELYPLIEKHFGMVPRRDDTVIDRRTGRCHDAQRYRDFAADLLSARAQPTPPAVVEPTELSPDFTDTARAALLWVLWHHQGGSSPVGQPIRFALGMGKHDGEEIEGPDGLAMMVDMSLWNDAVEALEEIIGGDDEDSSKAGDHAPRGGRVD